MNLFRRLNDYGVTSDALYVAGAAAAVLSILTWISAGGRHRGDTQRRALFAATFAPTLLLLGRGLEDAERTRSIAG